MIKVLKNMRTTTLRCWNFTSKIGTITLFAFDRGQGLSEHTAPFDAVVHILDGTAEITIGGKPQIVNAGEMLIMPANVSHALQAKQRFKMLLVMIRSD